jgi:hypothetical protein
MAEMSRFCGIEVGTQPATPCRSRLKVDYRRLTCNRDRQEPRQNLVPTRHPRRLHPMKHRLRLAALFALLKPGDPPRDGMKVPR